MWTDIRPAILGALLVALPAQAQTPLSAIDWLREDGSTPFVLELQEPPVSGGALPGEITVTEIGIPRLDAVGLVPAGLAGLDPALWGASTSAGLADRLVRLEPGILPEMRRLLFRMLIAELDPPADPGTDAALFLSRVDTLIAFGALDQAKALMERSGLASPAVFRRYFDAALLTGTEDTACITLRAQPDLSPGFAARIFCLARGGDWDIAALTLETARALGFMSAYEDALLTRFLDPVLFESAPPLVPPPAPTPLIFRMSEALGESVPTTNLPLAFAHADLRSTRGWRAQIEAAERLARAGSVPANLLLGLYTERLPAASGGVWDRVEAVQRLDVAARARDPGAVAAALPAAWQALAAVELEPVLAELFTPRLAGLPLAPEAAQLRLRLALLTQDFAEAAATALPLTPEDRFLIALATGRADRALPPDVFADAISDAFRASGPPARLHSLIAENRRGEAMLRAMALIEQGARGDLDELTDAIAFFRSLGMETVARRAALEVLILDRRG